LFDGTVIRWHAASLSRNRSPAEPSFHAFSFTRPSQNTVPKFVIAGSGEAREGGATYSERTVRYRDLSPGGLKEKVEFVAGAMEHRWVNQLRAEGYDGSPDLHGARLPSVFADALVRRGGAAFGPDLAFRRPPVIDLDTRWIAAA